MFKNPLKYQQGGAVSSEEQAENELVSVIAQALGTEEQPVRERLNQIKQNKKETEQLQEALKMMQTDKNQGFKALLTLFTTQQQQPAYKQGGKILDFICKHARGGNVNCNCKQQGGTFESEDKQVKIKNFGTAQADTTGTYSYPSTNGEFRFNPMGRTATVWDNTGGWPIHRYADQNWINRHPRRQMLPGFLGGHRKLAPAGFFENLVERVNNRTPKTQENGGVLKAQGGIGKAGKAIMKAAKNATKVDKMSKAASEIRIPEQSFILPSKLDSDIDKVYTILDQYNYIRPKDIDLPIFNYNNIEPIDLSNLTKEPWYRSDAFYRTILGGLFGGAAYAGAKMGESEKKKNEKKESQKEK